MGGCRRAGHEGNAKRLLHPFRQKQQGGAGRLMHTQASNDISRHAMHRGPPSLHARHSHTPSVDLQAQAHMVSPARPPLFPPRSLRLPTHPTHSKHSHKRKWLELLFSRVCVEQLLQKLPHNLSALRHGLHHGRAGHPGVEWSEGWSIQGRRGYQAQENTLPTPTSSAEHKAVVDYDPAPSSFCLPATQPSPFSPLFPPSLHL